MHSSFLPSYPLWEEAWTRQSDSDITKIQRYYYFVYDLTQKFSGLLINFQIAMIPCYRSFSLSGLKGGAYIGRHRAAWWFGKQTGIYYSTIRFIYNLLFVKFSKFCECSIKYLFGLKCYAKIKYWGIKKISLFFISALWAGISKRHCCQYLHYTIAFISLTVLSSLGQTIRQRHLAQTVKTTPETQILNWSQG